MRKLIATVILYLIVRSFVFLLTILLIFKDVKMVKLSDLRHREDWLMFIWLFLIPTLIEVVAFAFPFTYWLSRPDIRNNRLYYLLFLILFLAEFMITHWVIGMRYPLIKILVSLALFFLVFGKRLPSLAR